MPLLNMPTFFASGAKPPLGTPLNRSHSITRGMIMCLPLNEFGGDRVFDLCNPTFLNIFNSNKPTWFGAGLKFVGASSQRVDLDAAYNNIFPGGHVSLFAKFKYSGVTSTQGIVFIGGSAATYRTAILYVDTSNLQFLVRTTTGGAVQILNASPPQNVYTTVCGTWTADNVSALYYDGMYRGTDTSCIGATVTADTPTNYLGYFLGGGYLTGEIECVYGWNRGLSASEYFMLHVDPYCMFKSAIPVWMYYQEPAGGLSIPIAMHHYRQQRRL